MIRWILPHIHVPRSPHYAPNNLTGYSPGGASADARRAAACTDGSLLALHVLLLCAAGRTPTEIAAVLFCSRSSVYRIVGAYRVGTLGWTANPDGALTVPVRTAVRRPWFAGRWGPCSRRPPMPMAGVGHAGVAPHWLRSCTPSMALRVLAETVRRWLHELGWVWKRAKLVAKDTDPQRVERLARIRFHFERLGTREVMVFADELDIHLLPKVGYAWIPKGARELVMTPGQNAKHYLAGALNLTTGKLVHCLSPRKNNGLFRELLTLLDQTYPAPWVRRLSVVVDNYSIHQAKAVEQWLASLPAFGCFLCRPIVRGPIPLSECVATYTTNVHGITSANGYVI